MKTDIWINVVLRHEDDTPYWTGACRVKLDSQKFPYIVLNDEKIILISAEFPRTVKTHYEYMKVQLDCDEQGAEELKGILTNPELIAEKLSLKQIMRLA